MHHHGWKACTDWKKRPFLFYFTRCLIDIFCIIFVSTGTYHKHLQQLLHRSLLNTLLCLDDVSIIIRTKLCYDINFPSLEHLDHLSLPCWCDMLHVVASLNYVTCCISCCLVMYSFVMQECRSWQRTLRDCGCIPRRCLQLSIIRWIIWWDISFSLVPYGSD